MGSSPRPPPPPDYAGLAREQGQIDAAAAERQTVANRPNQYTPWGSSTWTRNDDGTWAQTLTLSEQDQAALDRARQFEGRQQDIASGLLDQASDSMGNPIDMSGLPELRGIDLGGLPERGQLDLNGLPQFGEMPDAGFGAVDEVRDAMMGRMAPARQRMRDAEIQRLKAQGIPENSEAFQRSLKRLDEGDTDAEQQALLGAMGAYGDIFQRGMSVRGQTAAERGQLTAERALGAEFANDTRARAVSEQDSAGRLAGLLRQQGLGEQMMRRQIPINDYLSMINGTTPQMPQMPSFTGATGSKGPDMYGAAQDQYGAAVDQENASAAYRTNRNSAVTSIATIALMAF